MRPVHPALVAFATFLAAPSAAHADQHVPVSDGGEVQCYLAAKGITRISLVGDAFASSVRRPVGEGQSDISVQSEPTRGDIYVSVPDGFPGASLSFFAISRKGFTYKFRCTLTQTDAQQIFVENPATGNGNDARSAAQVWEAPILLMKAMAARLPLTGYVVTNANTKPVQVGTLQVVSQAIYDGPDMVGKVLQISNVGTKDTDVSESDLSPPNALLASVTHPHLRPHEATEAFVVMRTTPAPVPR